ncbi:ATP-dependent helicase upf1 (Nonsense-mediated mRNA decay protein upf1) (Regulator of nonsense transcripts 1 homolog) (Up-frameshift suppressor 1) [Durusdinium trenchii]|uniref:ATP-dependent helicase upf1 (Nonsense-mediated mRNA decay protein upf1) (Regulator of nonsense transcripts 1 homolog) (Up-frameshift suppressor 1) n=1 Tax=Durusdinium trenchii TaxID=1381693 RepID=A0ABP0LD19_9DINO
MVVMRRHVQRLILVGDPEQLPSTVFSKKAKEIGFDRSLFERLMIIGKEKHTLARQYRMLPLIADFPNSAFYNGEVVNDETVLQMERRVQDYIYAPDDKWNFHTAIRLYDTGPGDYEKQDFTNVAISNPEEADQVIKLLQNFFRKNETDQRLSVGIISPYNGQVNLITEKISGSLSTVESKKLEKKVKLVKTVDGFQGNEQDIIVISTVRSNRKGNIGFVRDKRRLNVAITRARLRLWVIGDLTTLAAGDDTWRQFINFCKVRKLVQDVPSDRTQTERNVERLVRQGSGGYGPGPSGSGSSGGAGSSRTRPSESTARIAFNQAVPLGVQDDGDGTIWSSFFLQQLITTISGLREQAMRDAVVKKISQLLKGEASAWKPHSRRDGTRLQIWQRAVEETVIGGKNYLIWWVEIDGNGLQGVCG